MSGFRPGAPALSVVCAAFNAGATLRPLLESLCACDFRSFEVCLCDDASTDETPRVIASFAGRLDLRVARNGVNRGVTYSRNRAMAMAAAPLLLFVDADVSLRADTIGRLLRRMEATGADVVEGIYSDRALDGRLVSEHYALFVHHAFRGSGPREYNVFNGWCALCRREAMERLGGHAVVPKGIEIENEALGRRIVAAGYRLILDPGVAVDHHRGGLRKLLFIFTSRVYWWVKVFCADGRRFESALTTRAYGVATLCLPAAALALALGSRAAAAALCAGFLAGYGPFLAFALRRRGPAFAVMSAALCCACAPLIAASAAWSGAEELVRLISGKGLTLEPGSLSLGDRHERAEKRKLGLDLDLGRDRIGRGPVPFA